jgi:biotin carboxyl carrier protein
MGSMSETFLITLDQQAYSVTLEDLDDGQVRAIVDGRERVVDARRVSAGAWSLRAGPDARLVEVDGVPGKGKATVTVSHPDGEARQAAVVLADGRPEGPRGAAGRAGASGGAATLRAPIPGKLVKVPIKVGDAVKAGQTLLVLEAMKMENEIRAPHDAKVLALHVSEGMAVESGQDLVSLG